MSQVHSFAAQLAVSPPVASWVDFVTTFLTWIRGAAGALLDTSEKQKAAVDDVMKVYDIIAADVGRTSLLAGAAFGAARPTVETMVQSAVALIAVHPVPPPAPVVQPPVGSEPQGSAP